MSRPSCRVPGWPSRTEASASRLALPSSARRSASPAGARPRKDHAPDVPRPRDDDELSAYAKDVVDGLPPLTDEQRHLRALIFRPSRYTHLRPHDALVRSCCPTAGVLSTAMSAVHRTRRMGGPGCIAGPGGVLAGCSGDADRSECDVVVALVVSGHGGMRRHRRSPARPSSRFGRTPRNPRTTSARRFSQVPAETVRLAAALAQMTRWRRRTGGNAGIMSVCGC
jgi:hypothetical protein